jgi:hypothetical protein
MTSDRVSKSLPHQSLTIIFSLAIFCAVLNIVYAVLSGKQHDFIAHVNIWREVMRGADPWSMPSNTYGPAANLLFAPWVAVHELAPKVVYVLSWTALELSLVYQARKNLPLAFLLVCLFNSPLFLVEFAKWGHMEATLSLLVVGSVVLARREKQIPAGFLLALAVCVKYLPIVLLPFLMLRKRKVYWWMGASFALTVTILYAYCFSRWGASMLASIRHVSPTISEHMSVFRFLRGPYSPLQLVGVSKVDFLSLPLIAVGGLGVFYLYFHGRISQHRALLAAMLLPLTFYAVGYAQYWITYFALYFYYLASQHKNDLEQTLSDHIPMMLPLLFVSLFQCFHAYESDLFYGSLRMMDWAGLAGLFAFVPALAWCLRPR